MKTINEFKFWIKNRFPQLVEHLNMRPLRVIDRAYAGVLGRPSLVFSKIYSERRWGSKESFSGPGSSLKETAVIRQQLPILIAELKARSMLDAPCGDFNWMREVSLNLDLYIGVDVVPELIANNQRFASAVRAFFVLDIIKDELPRADIIFCRDCLVHLPTRQVWSVLRNFKKTGSTFLATTTFPGESPIFRTRKGRNIRKNCDVVMGRWRPLDFEQPPFGFPKPLKLIYENSTHATPARKCIAVWDLQTLRV